MTPRFYFLLSDLSTGRGNAVVSAVRLSWKGGPSQAVEHFLPED
jgi:hypothetical protein